MHCRKDIEIGRSTSFTLKRLRLAVAFLLRKNSKFDYGLPISPLEFLKSLIYYLAALVLRCTVHLNIFSHRLFNCLIT